MCKVEFSGSVDINELAKEFEAMAERGTLLTGPNASQEDLLIQILGTIVVVSAKHDRF